MSARQRQNLQQRRIAQKDRMRKKLAVTKGPKKICLAMIVKNEEANMPRLLDSLINVVDMVCIEDTGSTDNSKNTILDWGKKNNKPTVVHDNPFINFSHNRTSSVRMVRHYFPDADYILLSDADFVWNVDVGDVFDKTLLVDHKYMIRQYNKTLSYWNIRVLNAKIDWECIGVTHEYWRECKTQPNYQLEIRGAKITTLEIDDREDGGCKTDKFERDERLLREGLNDDKTPDDLKTRYLFYLAQTLKDMNRNEESIEYYNKRIEKGGWVEELYHSKFQLGYNYEQLGWKYKRLINLISPEKKIEFSDEEKEYVSSMNPEDKPISELVEICKQHFNDSMKHYLIAYNYRKTRAEALYYLTKLLRVTGNHAKAFEYALIGKKIKPTDDTLFVQSACYTYLFDWELSIVSFYVKGQRAIGREANARLLEYPNLPQHIMDMVISNAKHYL